MYLSVMLRARSIFATLVTNTGPPTRATVAVACGQVVAQRPIDEAGVALD